MAQQGMEPLTDDELRWIADNQPNLVNQLNSEERRRLSRIKPQAGDTLGAPDTSFGTQALDATGRFLAPIVRAPFDAIRFGAGIVTDPFNGFRQTREILGASADQLEQARTAQGEGRPGEAVLRAAASTPVIGPAVASIVDMAHEGDLAGAAGTATSMVLPMARGPIRSGFNAAMRAGADATLRGAEAAGLKPTLESAGAKLSTVAEDKMARAMSPQVGPNKTRFGNQAREIAPEIVRDPNLKSASMGGLDTRLETAYESAADGLDQAADARLVSQQVKVRPLLAKLDAEIARLQATPVEGSRIIPEYSATDRPVRGARPGSEVTAAGRTIKPGDMSRHERGYRTTDTGEFANEPTRTGRPIGRTVEPAPNASELATLRQMRSELAALGDVAPYESVRRIRQAWDKVAKVKYMPSTAQDVLKAQGDATAAAKGTSAMREALAETDPASAAAYKQYSLYKTAMDIRKAAQEAERTRPNRLRGQIRTLASSQGIVGITAALVDRAVELAPDMQVMVARRLAGVADLLKRGEIQQAQAVVDRTVAQLPKAEPGPLNRGWKVIKGGARTARRVGDLGREAALAAENQQEDQ